MQDYNHRVTFTSKPLKKIPRNAGGLEYLIFVYYSAGLFSPDSDEPVFPPSSIFFLRSARTPRSPRVAFSTLPWMFLTAFFVFSDSALASFFAASFSSTCDCSQMRV